MKAAFVEDLDSEHQDPLDAKHLDFPWDEIERVCDGIRVDIGDEKYQQLGGALIEILRSIIGAKLPRRGIDREIGRRLVAFAWTLRPDLIEGSPSLAEIARALDCNKVTLSLHSAQARRNFGIRNRAQSHAANFNPNKNDALPAHYEEGNEDNHDEP